MSGSRIFIKICSLDDTELVPTIADAIVKADKPENLEFGIYLHYKDKDTLLSLNEAISEFKKEGASFTIKSHHFVKSKLGVGNARHEVDSMYTDQDYVLQIDAHSWFPFSWDNRLIDLISYHDNKTILTGYAGPYRYENTIRTPVDLGKLMLKRYTLEKTINEWLYPQWITVYPESDDDMFIETDFCANFAFGTSEWGKYSGIDRNSIFFSEEPLQSRNLERKGFTLLYPNIDEPMVCHLYDQDIKTFGKRKRFTDYVSQFEADYLLNVTDRNYYEKITKF